MLDNTIKLQFNRAEVKKMGIPAYTICAQYKSKYPDFAKEFLYMDLNQVLSVNGQAFVKYGEGNGCGAAAQNGDVKVEFKHSTTAEGSNALKKKWYYKKCMEQKNSANWSARGGHRLPATEPCYMSLWDGNSARHYSWRINFVKTTDRMKSIISTVRNVVQTGLLPYMNEDFEMPDVNGDDIGAYMYLDVTFKNSDKNADIRIETSQGTKEFKDYALKLSWTQRLRNMKMTRMMKRLIDNKIIYPCVATVGSVQTNDNVTYPYTAGDCWTLTSAHCGSNPAYAVFTKKVGNRLAVKAYLGGHLVEINDHGDISINGQAKSMADESEETLTVNDEEILKVYKWGTTYNIYSFLKVWIATDNVFVQVMPAPSTRGQHCGICGTYNRNMFDEWTDRKSVV